MNCVRCGTPTANAKSCPQCGLRVVRLPGAQVRDEPGIGGESAWGQLTRDASDEGRRALYAEAVGDKNSERYLRLFDKFEREGKTSVGWHWPAFFVTFWWLLYRKMYGKAVLYFLGWALVAAALGIGFGVWMPQARFDPVWVGLAGSVCLVLFFVLPPLFADASYYHHCGALIAGSRTVDRGREGQLQRVAGGGGTSLIPLVVVCAIWTPFIFLGTIAFQAYQEYMVRAKTHGALIYGKQVASVIGNYHETQKRFPPDLQTVVSTPLPANVLQDMQLDPANGVLTLVASAGPEGGRSFALVPSQDVGGRIVWKCQTVDMKPALLPAECR